MDPRQAVRSLEHSREHGGGGAAGEHMAGYGVMGLTFDSGHALAFLCLTASSIGPPYVSVWHRHPGGRWVIHTNIEPSRACPRYFGPALHAYEMDDIGITWTGPSELSIAASHARLKLALRLAATPLTRLLGVAARAAPGSVLQRRRAGAVAGRFLDAGPLSLAGSVPAGHTFIIRPRALWRVAAAAAVIEGRDAGAVMIPAEQDALGEFAIPQRGLFGTGRVTFTPPPVARLFP
jgi:hypothetical protein